MKDNQQNYTEILHEAYIEMNSATCTCEELDQIFEVVRKSWSKSSKFSHLQELRERLNVVGIPSEEDRDLPYYRNLVREAKNKINSGNSQIPQQMLKRLKEATAKYPTPGEYMQRLVDRLSGDDDPWKEDKLRLRILKRFVQDGNYLRDAGFGGRNEIRKYVKKKTGKAKVSDEDVLEHLDDGIFDLLESGKPVRKENMTETERRAWKKAKDAWDANKKRNGKYSLLKVADDLAEGNFPSGGSTKEYLYLFAMAYNMTWYRPGGTEVMDGRTDIEKNLFQDYYFNNVMRFLSAVYQNTPEAYENPTGQGINPKNFAEAIYLYFIRQQKFRPAEKIKLASKMIDRVKNAPESASSGDTAHYRTLLGEDSLDLSILNLSEDDFESYVRTHYNCNTFVPPDPAEDKKSYSRDLLAVESAQNTAFQKHQEILEKLREVSRNELLRAKERGYKYVELPHYEWTLEVAVNSQKLSELLEAADSMLGHMPKNKNKKDEKTDLEREEEKKLSEKERKIRRKEKNIAALSIQSAEEMSRSALVAVYYYYFNALHAGQKQVERDLDRFWVDFTGELDQILEEAHYLPMSRKDIGDVLTVCAAYVLQMEKSSAE